MSLKLFSLLLGALLVSSIYAMDTEIEMTTFSTVWEDIPYEIQRAIALHIWKSSEFSPRNKISFALTSKSNLNLMKDIAYTNPTFASWLLLSYKSLLIAHNQLKAFYWSSNNSYVGTVAKMGSVRIWDSKNGDLINKFIFINPLMESIALNKDVLIVPDLVYSYAIDVNTGKKIHTFKATDPNSKRKVLFANNNGFAAVNRDKNKIILIKPTGEILNTIEDHNNLMPILLSSDDQYMLTLTDKNQIKIWNCNTSVLVSNVLVNFDIETETIKLTDDNRLLAITGQCAVKIWDVKENKEYFSASGLYPWTSLSLDGSILVISCEVNRKNDITVYDLNTKNPIFVLPEDDYASTTLISSDNKLLITATKQAIQIWDLHSRKLIKELKGTSRIKALLSIKENIIIIWDGEDSLICLNLLTNTDEPLPLLDRIKELFWRTKNSF